MLTIILLVLLGLVLAGIAAVALLGRGTTLVRGRFGRLAQIGRLSARLSTSRLGAAVRRRFTRKSRRAAYDESRRRADAEAMTRTMGEMKGAFMKLGQMMSFVSDDVPAEYRAALRSLQAQAPAMDFTLIREVAERSLGKPLERAFARFDAEPIAAASIGQVHRARLPTGEEVVVKIQYPGVAEAIRADLQNVGVLYRMIGLFYPGLDTGAVIDEVRSRVLEELDYEREAANQILFYDLYRDHPFIRVPRVFRSHSTAVVLTSEYVAGRSFESILATADAAAKSRYGEILYRFVFGSLIKLGVFNGDPHPGNYIFDADGRIVFLDYGCIKYFPEPMMRSWMALVRAYLDGNPTAFCKFLVELDFFKTADLPENAVFTYFGYFNQPFTADHDFTFTRAYNAKSIEMVFKPKGEIAAVHKRMNMPRDFVLVNRIQWGVYSILGQLEATGNWHSIHREYLYNEAPRTKLGRADRDYWARWCAEHDLAHNLDLIVTPDGIRERRAA